MKRLLIGNCDRSSLIHIVFAIEAAHEPDVHETKIAQTTATSRATCELYRSPTKSGTVYLPNLRKYGASSSAKRT